MKKIYSCLIAVTYFVFSCNDVFEEDITSKRVTLITPKSGKVILGDQVNFSWSTVNGVDDYQIEVLDVNNGLVIDSVVQKTHLNYALTPGNYKWRVKGKNFAYETPFSFPEDFKVELLLDLESQKVKLVEPKDNVYLNTADIILKWEALSAADSYALVIKKGGAIVFEEEGITATSYTTNAAMLDEDGMYIWQVKAVNSSSSTKYFSRTLTLDTTKPATVELLNPLNKEAVSVNASVVFNWKTNNNDDVLEYVLEIGKDENYNEFEHISKTSQSSFNYTFKTIGTYYWRVKVKDKAGNESGYSPSRTLQVN